MKHKLYLNHSHLVSDSLSLSFSSEDEYAAMAYGHTSGAAMAYGFTSGASSAVLSS